MTRDLQHPDWVVETLRELPPLLTANEASKVLRCSRRALTRLVQSGQLNAHRATGMGSSRLLISLSDLVDFLASMTRA